MPRYRLSYGRKRTFESDDIMGVLDFMGIDKGGGGIVFAGSKKKREPKLPFPDPDPEQFMFVLSKGSH